MTATIKIGNSPLNISERKNNLSESELNAKNYIEQYKSQFPKESIRTALVNAGTSPQDVDNYINKYY